MEREALETFARSMQALGWEVRREKPADDQGWPYDLTLTSDDGQWCVDYSSYGNSDVTQNELIYGWTSFHEETGKNLILLDANAGAIVEQGDANFLASILHERRAWRIQTSIKGLDSFIRIGLMAVSDLPTQFLDVLHENGMATNREVAGILRAAIFLLTKKRAEQGVLSTTTLFFGIVEYGRQLGANESFSSALARYVDTNFASDYEDLRNEFFSEPPRVDEESLNDNRLAPSFELSKNVISVLIDAKGRSTSRVGGPTIETNDLIESLFAARNSGLAGRLSKMSSLPPIDEILQRLREDVPVASMSESLESEDVVSTHATSDLWTVDDKLGYAEYARAIYHFLNDPRTEPPLTISIQAPWGAGKTSLMRMVQKQLDPEGYRQQTENRRLTLQQTLQVTTKNILDELRNLDRKSPTAIELNLGSGSCATVWFNAWRYESSDQIWAGLAESIIRGITDRLKPVDREKFLLRLHLSRVNPNQIRGRFYDAVFSRLLGFFRSIGIWVLLGLATIGSFFWDAELPVGESGIAVSIGLSTVVIAGLGTLVAFLKAHRDASQEPAKFSLSEYIEVPNYSERLGFVHHVTEDLRRVLELLPRKCSEGREGEVPLAIFIDDLDRCSPAKVADVFEAINLFVAGEFPNCYILIGMDTEVVAAALEEAHKDVIARLPLHSRRVPVGWRFMDKFVQLPFVIPPIDVGAIGDYAEHLAAAEDVQAHEVQRRATGEEARLVEARMRASLDSGEQESKILEEAAQAFAEDLEETDTKAVQESRRLAAQRLDSLRRQRFIDQRAKEFRSDNEKIERLLLRAKEHLSSNPRELKRLVNVYRFYYNLRLARQSRNLDVPTDEQLQNWLILSLAWPEVIRWVRRGFSDWDETPEYGEARTDSNVVGQRLATLEKFAVKQVTRSTDDESLSPPFREDWSEAVRLKFELPKDTPWLMDRRLFAFFRYLGHAHDEVRISMGAGRGFW